MTEPWTIDDDLPPEPLTLECATCEGSGIVIDQDDSVHRCDGCGGTGQSDPKGT